MINVLRQTYLKQQGSDGSVWLMRTNPGAVQLTTGCGLHTFGLQITVLVDSLQTQF